VRYVSREFYRDRNSYADRIYASEDTFAVADGMGIGPGGKLAAEKAVDLVARRRPFRSIGEILKFFEEANREIMKEIAMLGDRHAAGTTLSLLGFTEGVFLIGHVGDSRIYLFREGRLKLLTQDQVTYRGGKKYVSALGIDWRPEVYTLEDNYLKGDRFLLISDGAVEVLSEEDMERAMNGDIDASAERLLEMYRQSCPEEDLSFIIVSVD